MFTHNIDPVLFSIGSLEIRYYGIIYALGFFIGYYLIYYLAQKRGMKFSKEDSSDLIFYLVIGTVVGARLFEVFVYNFSYYMSNPLLIPAVWRGGLSFHGGFVGSVVSLLLFCRKKKIKFYDLADLIVIPLSIGLFLGRIANFINAELVGRVTDVSWCVNFPNADGCRHPSQLYESLKNLVIFSVLWVMKDKKLGSGFMFWTFVVLYSILRFFVEFFRAPDPQLGLLWLGLTMGQWLNVVMLGIGIYFLRRKDLAN